MRAIGFHWHAVQRDILSLGLHAADMFTPKLTASEVLSLIVASPPNSALFHVLDNGTMLASLETNQPDWRSQRKPPAAEAKSEFKTIADYEAHRAKIFNRKG